MNNLEQILNNDLENKFNNIVNRMTRSGVSFNIEKHKDLFVKILVMNAENENTEGEKDILNDRINTMIDLENHYEDGKVFYNMKPWGTVTGRPSTTDFNISSTPSKKKILGEEIRKCFEVPEGKTMVGFDASNLELRLLAHFMNDLEYINTVENGDIHTLNQQKAGLKTRDEAKEFIYTLLYGGGIKLLSKKLNCDEKTAKNTKFKFLNELPKLKDLIKKIEQKDSIKTLEGIEIEVDEDYKGLNYLLQSNASVVMKRIMVIIDEKLKELNYFNSIQLKINVYDECHYEVENDYIDKFYEIISDAVDETTKHYNLRCRLDCGIKKGSSWAETH